MWTIIIRGIGDWLRQKEGGWFLQPGWFVSGWFEKGTQPGGWTITEH